MIRSVLFSFACMVIVVAAFAGTPAAVQLVADTRHIHAGDTLYTVVVVLKGKPNKKVPTDARFVLADAALAPQSLPLLLDSMPAGRFDNTGKYQATLRVRVKALKCLGRSENFSIMLAGKPTDKVVVIIDPTAIPAASMTLQPDTSYLVPWLPLGPVQEFQSIMPAVELAGIPADDNNFLDLSIPAFYTTRLPSAPAVAANNRLIIPKAQFIKKDGCPVSVRVPAIIKLKKIDSLAADEVFNILCPGDPDHAHTVIIKKAKAPAAAQQPNRPAARATGPVRGFHFACQNQPVLFVSLVEDSMGNLQKILVNQFQTNDTLQYYVLNLYDAPVFATWLTSAFTGIGRDCAAYLASRVGNELKEEDLARTKKTPVTVPNVHANASPPAAATAAVTSKSDTATAGTKKATASKAPPIRLDGSTTTFHPVYDHKDSLRTERVSFYVIRDSMPTGGFPASDTLTFTLDKYTLPASGLKEDFTIFTETGNSFIVHKSDWKVRENVTHDSSFSAPVYVNFKNVRIDSIREDHFANIRLEGNTTSFHRLQLTETGMYNPSNPFWLDLGTNFDLLDGIQPNNLYSGVYGFKKDVGRIHINFRNKKSRDEHRKNYSNNLGFTAGVYETQSSSLAFGSDSGYVYRDGRSYLYDSVSPAKKGYPYYRDTGAVKNTITVKSIGIFFSPHLRLTNKPAESEGLHVFLSAYIEMLWQKVKSDFDYTNSGRDTVMYKSSLDGIYPMQYKETSKNIDYRSHYFGLGVPVYLKDNTFSLYVNSVAGICNQRFVAVQDSNWVHTGSYKTSPATAAENFTLESLKGFQQPACNWNFFYLFQFRLNEEKYGISFTGEVRGLMLKNAKSIIALSLSKKIDLGDLYHTIVKPFTPGGN